ncbi:ribonuclease P protein component [Poritiphilus flavus]|uniref:Ribonuclease P protein component n=1 Tax=Poritiphilus flavus TaxID=2697053 RepID=A0A6L9E8V2_9FLAO|nr:ribonuclease P protein component [Poritiphilus flavus]NAS11033.1 ribonuclease P protein component [Poritiphilus flavus]
MRFTFPKSEKLKSKKLIGELFLNGQSITVYPLRLVYLKLSDPGPVAIRAGVSVPKKKFKSAVKRNRIKRLLRENYRLNKHRFFNNIEGNFAFLFLYIGKEMPSYRQLEKSMSGVIQKFLSKEGHAQIDP